VVTPEVPAGGSVGQAVFSDETDGPLLDAAGVLAVGQGQVGKITGEATATAQAPMPRESDEQINGAFGPSIPEVVQGTGADAVAAGAATTARAGSRRPVAAAVFDTGLGQILDTGDALSDVRDILTWTVHRRLS
jgi:hypothetical protein